MIAPNSVYPGPKLKRQLLRKYDLPVPRYTSYPTALQFNEAYTHQDKNRDLQLASRSQEPLSVYVHLPFCASVCLFCGCNVTPTRDRSRSDRYLQYLIKEMDLTLKSLGNSRPIEQLHFGGGSPTFFSPKQLARLLCELQRRFAFTPDAEISVECNPRETTSKHLRVMRDLGVNRLSFGVQDLDEKVQTAVNRIEPESMLQALIHQAKTLKYDSISLDLIYGLPHQSTKSFHKTLERIVDIRPHRIALFNFAYLPEKISRQRGLDAEALPSRRMKQNIFEDALSFLTQSGYCHIGMDHFALPDDSLSLAMKNGTLNRNFQGYHARPSLDLIGLGVGSIGNLGPSYSQNHKSIALWEAFLDNNKLPVDRGIHLTHEDLWRRQVIHDILCRNTVDFETVARSFHKSLPALVHEARTRLQEMEQDDLIYWNENVLNVTETGRLLVRNIASHFDAYFSHGTATNHFSRSI